MRCDRWSKLSTTEDTEDAEVKPFRIVPPCPLCPPRWIFSRALPCILAALTIVLPSCSRGRSSRTTIAVVPKGQAHVFWQSVRAGAEKCAAEEKVDMIWTAPSTETDYAFTLIELRVGPKGSLEGKTSLTNRIVVDAETKTLALENYAAATAALAATSAAGKSSPPSR